MNKLLIVSLLFVIGVCLKQSQIGRNDWHIQNIGELSHLQFIKNKFFFLTRSNVLGFLNVDNGQIQTRVTLSEHQTLIGQDDKQITFVSHHNQIIRYKVHNLEKQINNRFVNDKILKNVKSYIKTTNDILINDEKNIRSYKYLSGNNNAELAQTFASVYTAEPDQIIQKVFNFQNKIYAVLSKNNQIIFRQIVYGQLDIHVIYPEFKNNQNGQSKLFIEEIWQNSNKLVVLLKNQQNQKYQTVVLNNKFIQIYQVSQRYNQLFNSQLTFCTKIYDLKKNQEVQRVIVYSDSNRNFDFSVQDQQNEIVIFKDKQSEEYASIKKDSSQQKLLNVFFFQKSSIKYYVALQFSDMTLQLYTVNHQSVQKIWSREQGLAYVDKVLFMKYQFTDHLDNEYHRNLFSDSYKQMSLAEKFVLVPSNIALRVIEQLKDLKQFVLKTINSLFDFQGLDWQQISKFNMSEEQEIRLGLKKYIIAITKKGTIYSIDTKTSKTLWKKQKNLVNQEVISLIRLRKDYELQTAILITYNSVENVISFQEIKQDGTIALLKKFSAQQKPSVHKLNQDSVILKIQDKTLKYQLGQSHDHQKHFYFYTKQAGKITGWKQLDENVVQIWNLHLDQGQKILATAQAYTNEHRSFIPLLDNGKVIFKNVDFTNLAVLTSKNSTSMSLYIINGMTGQVHFNQYRSGLNLNHPVNLVYNENNVLVTYYNNRNKLYQIWTVEEYQQKIETSPIRMITEYLQGVEYKPSRNRQNIIFLSEVYASPVSIKKLFISESKQSLIRRNLIIITRDYKLYMIGRQLVSARRPKQTALFSNQAYPAYNYLLPLQPNKFFSYNLPLYDLENIHFSCSDMESTIFVFGYGTDMIMIRIAPDMPFDMITEDFNYIVLVIIIIAVTIGVFVLKEKARKAKLTKKHKD